MVRNSGLLNAHVLMFLLILACLVNADGTITGIQDPSNGKTISSAFVGTPVQVTGTGLSPNTTITISLTNTIQGSYIRSNALILSGGTTTGNGTFSTLMIVPALGSDSPWTINASTANPQSQAIATSALTITPSIFLSANSGLVGSSVQVTGMGFASNEDGIVVVFNSSSPNAPSCAGTYTGPCTLQLVPLGSTLISSSGTVSASSTGNWAATFIVPNDSSNTLQTVSAIGSKTGSSGSPPSSAFTIIPSIVLNETRDFIGSSVQVIGTGFASNEQGISVSFGSNGASTRQCTNTSTGPCTVILAPIGSTSGSSNGTITASPIGNWVANFPIPNEASGNYVLNAIGVYTGIPGSGNLPVASFTVIIPPAPGTSLNQTSAIVSISGGSSFIPPSILVTRSVNYLNASFSDIQFTLQNPGSSNLTNLIYTETMQIQVSCSSIQFLEQSQNCSTTDGMLTATWNISKLDPGQAIAFQVTVPSTPSVINLLQFSSTVAFAPIPPVVCPSTCSNGCLFNTTVCNAPPQVSVSMQSKATVGSMVTVVIKLNNTPLANTSVSVTSPDGKQSNYTSNGDGQVQVPASNAGTYTISLANYSAVGTTSFTATAPPPPAPAPVKNTSLNSTAIMNNTNTTNSTSVNASPINSTEQVSKPEPQGTDLTGIIILVVVIAAVAAGIWYYFKKKSMY